MSVGSLYSSWPVAVLEAIPPAAPPIPSIIISGDPECEQKQRLRLISETGDRESSVLDARDEGRGKGTLACLSYDDQHWFPRDRFHGHPPELEIWID